jgi:hypothetical protein
VLWQSCERIPRDLHQRSSVLTLSLTAGLVGHLHGNFSLGCCLPRARAGGPPSSWSEH